MSSQNSIIRVAQVVRPAAGGIRKHVSLLTTGLDGKRFATAVYAPADFTMDTDVSDVPQHIIDIGARTNIAADWRAICTLAKQLRGNADLVHAHGLRAALVGVLAAKRAGVPSLFTAHNLVPPMGRLQRALLRHIGDTTRRILAVSNAVGKSLEATGLPADKIEIVPNGILLAAFDVPDETDIRGSLHIPAHAPLVVGIGRLSREKGFNLLVTAFAEVLSTLPDAHLLIVGDGPERDALRALAAPLSGSCHFPGRIDNVVPILNAADVIAVPSRQEGQGIVALEAMAARKPVIAAQVGGLVETVVPNRTGLLISPENSAEFASALTFLLQTPARCHEMGIQGRLRVEQLYTLARMIHNIQTIYQNTLEV